MFFLRVAAFSLGCGAVLVWPDPLPLWLAAALLSMALWRRVRWPLLLLLAGAGWTEWAVQQRLADRWPVARHGEDVEVRAVVADLPQHQRTGEGTATWRFMLTPDAEARAAGVPERIRASWYRTSETVAVGECRRWVLRLRSPRGSRNPGGFDYEGWLFREGIGAVASVRSAQSCAQPLAPSPMVRVHQWRARLLAPVAQALQGHPALPLVAALGLGDGRGLRDDDWAVARATGTTHLLVISGLHLSLVAALGYGLIRLIWPLWPAVALRWPTPYVAGFGAAVLASGYALLAGLETPVLRALLMVWLALLLAWRGRWRHPFRALACVWSGVLLLDPVVMLRPGLWLSFGAVAGILWLTVGRLRRPPAWQVFVGLQLGLGLLLIPMTVGFFGGATVLAPMANLLAVPAFTLLTPFVLLAVLMMSVWPAAGLPLLQGVAAGLAGLWNGLSLLAEGVPGAWWPWVPSPLAAALAMLGVGLLVAPRGLPLRPLGLICLLPMLWPTDTAPSRGFSLALLDVGQGLAAVVRTRGHTLVYDAGPAWPDGFDAGAMVVVPYLRQQGVRAVDHLMLSHGDLDHAGGVAALRQALPVHRHSGVIADQPCRSGQQWTWDGVRFTVLHPERDAPLRSHNNASCVLRVEGEDGVLLLAGDIEAAAERRLLARSAPEVLQASVLVAPHHGSRTSSTAAWVAAVQPEVVLFSAGWRHHFGHPHPEVEARWRASGARTFVSGDDGALLLRWAAGQPVVTRWRLHDRRRWTAPAIP